MCIPRQNWTTRNTVDSILVSQSSHEEFPPLFEHSQCLIDQSKEHQHEGANLDQSRRSARCHKSETQW